MYWSVPGEGCAHVLTQIGRGNSTGVLSPLQTAGLYGSRCGLLALVPVGEGQRHWLELSWPCEFELGAPRTNCRSLGTAPVP